MICTWGQLAQLRAAGQRPAMTLIVSTSRRFAWNVGQLGAMTILQQRGEPMPVELLDGLDVIFHLDNCDQNAAVLRLMRSKGVIAGRAGQVRCWCKCFEFLDSGAAPCSATRQSLAWIESLPAGSAQAVPA